MNRTTIDFGIDLGTTNSSIAVIDGVDAKVIQNKGGSGVTPSAVWFDKRGNTHVGLEARLRALVTDPANADLEFKLRMGRGKDGGKRFERSDRVLLPQELSAEVLKSLKMDAQSTLGEDLRAAVITVPAAFENPQTNATRKAAELAGFTRSPLLLEPVAASLAYGFQSESENVYWFVYDFGGGTFDAAVMRIRDGMIQVVNHDGDNFLGGKLIDWDLVMKRLVPALTEEFDLPDFQRGVGRWQNALGALKYHTEEAKIQVCRTKAPAEIYIENLCEDASGKAVEFTYVLTPEDVEQTSRPHIEQSLALCKRTLEHKGLSGSDMDRILMVGGTTLSPWVRDAVRSELGVNVEFGIDPVTVVARGAAIFASTQELPADRSSSVPAGTWRVEVEHKPVGNVQDPDIGGRVFAPNGESASGYSIELVDTKSEWRSGRIALGDEGVFMTQLYAERAQRHEYAIEFHDPTGTQVPITPDVVSYTIGVVPEENPPASRTICIGLADGTVAPYVKKGAKLPARERLDHYTTLSISCESDSDVLRIPLLEGEHARAERNHTIGAMEIRGSDIKRDLPAGSEIEITVLMDKSQQLRIQAYVSTLDEEFEVAFDPLMNHKTVEELRAELSEQKSRLSSARQQVEETEALSAEAALARIESQELISQADSLAESAANDDDARQELDRRVKGLAAAVDEVEDSVEWPVLLEKARESSADTEKVVEEHGSQEDRARCKELVRDLTRATDAGDPDLLRSCTTNLDVLYFTVLDRQPGWHVSRFEWLTTQADSMRDPGQAEQIIAQGRRAMNNNDIDALKAANRQLFSLLPREVQRETDHVNRGGTNVVR